VIGDELSQWIERARLSLGLPSTALHCLSHGRTKQEIETRAAIVETTIALIVDSETVLSDAAREELGVIEGGDATE
jgi:hypothetical protein